MAKTYLVDQNAVTVAKPSPLVKRYGERIGGSDNDFSPKKPLPAAWAESESRPEGADVGCVVDDTT